MTAAIATAFLSTATWAATYHDPQHRFQISIPVGWEAEPFGEGVKFAAGNAYCLVLEGQAESPSALLKHLVSQFAGQWTGLQ